MLVFLILAKISFDDSCVYGPVPELCPKNIVTVPFVVYSMLTMPLPLLKAQVLHSSIIPHTDNMSILFVYFEEFMRPISPINKGDLF